MNVVGIREECIKYEFFWANVRGCVQVIIGGCRCRVPRPGSFWCFFWIFRLESVFVHVVLDLGGCGLLGLILGCRQGCIIFFL